MGAKLRTTAAPFATAELLQKTAYEHLLAHTLDLAPVFPLTAARFESLVNSARRELPGLAYQLDEKTKQILALRQSLLNSPKRYPGLEQDIDRLVPGDFLARTPHRQLPHLLRYLKTVQVRAERASLQPAKDTEKARQLLPFANWEKRVPAENHETFRWMLEEFRVSIFAQELGTAQPVSAQRLKALL
jgi:ATP-dependent helicase HrpA